MPIVTTDPTQQKIHRASHGGAEIVELLVEELRRAGLTAGKEHPGLKLSGCSTDVYAEDELALRTLEVKYSASSPICPECEKVESDHLAGGCAYAGKLRPSHKNCGNRFRDAVGSITNQWTSNYVRSMEKAFVPCFLYVDLCDRGEPHVHDRHVRQVLRAGGLVRVYTEVPTVVDIASIAEWLRDAVDAPSKVRSAVSFDV